MPKITIFSAHFRIKLLQFELLAALLSFVCEGYNYNLSRAIGEDKVSILTHCLMTVNTTGKHLEGELFSMQT